MQGGRVRCAVILSALGLSLVGCGAKTGLSARDDTGRAGETDAGRDAGRDPGTPVDSGFDTFPCRWMYSQSIVVARGALDASFGALEGAVAPRREQALSLAGGVGGVTDLADPPSILHEGRVDEASGDFVAFDGGWLQIRGDAGESCRIVEHDESLGLVATETTLLPAPCFADENDGSDVLITAVGEDRITVRPPRGGRFFEIDASVDYARSVRLPDGGVLVAAMADGRMDAYAITARGAELRASRLAAQTLPFVVAPDRLRGGMVVLRFAPGGTWRLERLQVEGGEIRLSEAADLTTLPAQPFTSLATNETESLFPLTNGALAFVPLNGSEPRVLEPVPEPAVTHMIVSLRPGESTGGLTYTHAADGTDQVLRFRPLVCNR